MIDFTSNISVVLSNIGSSLKGIDTDALTREMAATAAAMMRYRIHNEGKASDDSQIGDYSDGYMKVRTNTFGNRKKITRGKNKGKANENDAGTYTRGKNKNDARPVYKRTADKKVVLSLTRNLENDWGADKIFPVPGGWAVGFVNNPDRGDGFTNADIARNAERMYGKKIFNLSESETDTMKSIAERYIRSL